MTFDDPKADGVVLLDTGFPGKPMNSVSRGPPLRTRPNASGAPETSETAKRIVQVIADEGARLREEQDSGERGGFGHPIEQVVGAEGGHQPTAGSRKPGTPVTPTAAAHGHVTVMVPATESSSAANHR